MGDVNYNQSAATQLTEDINSAIDEIKVAIDREWTPLKTEFRSNWVGEDEDAFEGELIKTVQDIFYNTNSIAGNANTFIINAVNALADFQSGVSQNFGGATVARLNDYVHAEKTLDVAKETQSFSESTQRGLVSDGSDQKLIAALTTFCENVNRAITGAYEKVDVGQSFVSSVSPDNAMGMKSFVEAIGSNSALLTNVLNTFKDETIPQLVEAYKKQNETVVSDSQSASSNIESEVMNSQS